MKEGDAFYKDFRELRQIKAHCSEQKTNCVLYHQIEIKLKSKTISLIPPNTISLMLNISNRHYNRARCYFMNKLHRCITLCQNYKGVCMDERSAELYDYFEDVQISIIFAYSAVESFANTAIPLSFKYERLNNKGIKEILSKENIERWCSTTEKTGDVLPLIFMMDSPKTTSFWPDFKKLEGLRNDIVHLKTSNRDINDEGHYLKVFFEDETYNAIKSAESIIRYFCNNRDPLPYFPCFIGMDGPVKISALEDVKLAEHLEEIRQD